MALFKRNKTESVMPEEVQNFYAAERRQRKGTAWLLAIVTLLVTFLIASALFFGGRWIYRAIFDNDNKDKTSTSQDKAAETQKTEENTNTPSSSTSSQPSTSSSSNSSSQSGSNAGSSTNTPSTTTQTTTQTVPATGPTELVNTGPGDENW